METVNRISVFCLILICVLAGGARGEDQTMREKVYQKLNRSQVATEAGDWDRAYSELARVEKMDDLTSLERAQLYTAYGYTYFTQERITDSVAAYEKVLLQQGLTTVLLAGTHYTLGQLYFHLESFEQSATHLETWFKTAGDPGPEPCVLLGQAYYRLGRLEAAARFVQRAIDVAETRDRQVPEQWYMLLQTIYHEAKDNDNLIEVLQIMVARYPTRGYWLHLASVCGDVGDLERQLAVYEMAHTQGFLRSSEQVVLLGQLLLQADIPYRAGRLLQDGLASGAVTGNAANWRLLSQAWSRAREHEAAIFSLKKAAELSSDGELYARLSQSYARLSRWELSVDAAGTALDSGVKNPYELHLIQGVAYYELGQFGRARAAFSRIQRSGKGWRSASRWLAYVEKEELRLAELGVGTD